MGMTQKRKELRNSKWLVTVVGCQCAALDTDSATAVKEPTVATENQRKGESSTTLLAWGSEEALEQHLRDSPAHAPSFKCETCDQSFNSKKALKQHLRDSPMHSSFSLRSSLRQRRDFVAASARLARARSISLL